MMINYLRRLKQRLIDIIMNVLLCLEWFMYLWERSAEAPIKKYHNLLVEVRRWKVHESASTLSISSEQVHNSFHQYLTITHTWIKTRMREKEDIFLSCTRFLIHLARIPPLIHQSSRSWALVINSCFKIWSNGSAERELAQTMESSFK